MSTTRKQYVDLVLQASRNPDVELPIDDEQFDALLADMNLTRADFANHWQAVRDVSAELARVREATPEPAVDSERFPTALTPYKTRVI